MGTRKFSLALVAILCWVCTASRGDVRQTILSPPQVVNQWYYLNAGPAYVVGGIGTIDLNGDGVPDLTFSNGINTFVGTERGFYATVQPASGVAVVQENFPPYVNYFQATPLALADSIGPASNLSSVMVPLVDPTFGNPSPLDDNRWSDQALHYLGFSLTNGTNTQYGWLAIRLGAITPIDDPYRLDGYVNAGNGIEIDSFALESDPNTPVAAGIAPEPTGMGIMLCAATVVLLRRPRACVEARSH